MKLPAGQLKALARRVEGERREAGKERSKYPSTRVESLVFICPVHLNDPEGVAAVVNRNLGPRTTVERIQVVVGNLIAGWEAAGHGGGGPAPDGEQPGVAGLSVTTAYISFMYRVLRPARLVPGSPEEALFLTLLPHLVRDLLVNHSFHIVSGFRRVGARGTRQMLNGLDNIAEFSAIMLFCVAHYTGDHQECGLERTDYGTCAESVNIAHSAIVVAAATDAITKVVTFVAQRRVTDVGAVYPNQQVLINHFNHLYICSNPGLARGQPGGLNCSQPLPQQLLCPALYPVPVQRLTRHAHLERRKIILVPFRPKRRVRRPVRLNH